MRKVIPINQTESAQGATPWQGAQRPVRTTLAFVGTCLFALWLAFDAVADSPLELFAPKCASCYSPAGKGQLAKGRKPSTKDVRVLLVKARCDVKAM